MHDGVYSARMCAASCSLEPCIVHDVVIFFFFQAEDGIRDLVRSRGLGDVYKRQHQVWHAAGWLEGGLVMSYEKFIMDLDHCGAMLTLSLIHI